MAIPITIITGFLGSGKTTLILNLLPQLLKTNPSYKLALLKNEFGDLAIDSQLAASSSISGVRELLNGCICCNLVGQLGPALSELTEKVSPDRIVIETSGSAFPATLAMEINRLARQTGKYTLDGVVTVIDCENWKGYKDTSYTATIQAKYTDLVVLNKWEVAGERRLDECLDRLGDLELEVPVNSVKSDKGRVSADLVFGVDAKLAKSLEAQNDSHDHHSHSHDSTNSHQSEVEVLSITLSANSTTGACIDTKKLETLLRMAPKDEVYRIKAILTTASQLKPSDEDVPQNTDDSASGLRKYILNWAFGRWTSTIMLDDANTAEVGLTSSEILRMTMILARYESTKWKNRLETGGFIETMSDDKGALKVEKIS